MVFIKVGDDESVAVFTGENLIAAKTPYSTDDTSKHSVSMEKLDELKEKTSPIKLGLTHKGTDTTSEHSQSVIKQRGCHPALVDMYLTHGGRIYRAMTTHVELGFTISDFEEDQYHLSQLKDTGFVVFNGEIDELRNYFV